MQRSFGLALYYMLVWSALAAVASPIAPPTHAIPESEEPIFSADFSKQPVATYPGGWYKSSNVRNFPASDTMSGALVSLLAGGMREPHWHQPDEWAYVINGTCRATMVDQGPMHPAESWDFQAGDLWYFPSNVGHAILGIHSGCTFLTVYNVGDFDEAINARGLSNWVSTAPPAIVAQAFGTNQKDVESHISRGIDGFMPRGKLATLTAGQSDPPLLAARASPWGVAGSLQGTPQFHRYALSLGQIPEVVNDGGWIKLADNKVFPASENLIGALVYAAPYSLRQMHWHITADEWEFMLNGTVELGIFNETGHVTSQTLRTGDVGFVPRGAGHWIKNPTAEPGYMILVFNSGTFTNVDLPNWLGSFPAEYAAIALNTSVEFAESWQFSGGEGVVGAKRGNYTQIRPSGRQYRGKSTRSGQGASATAHS